MDLARQEVIKQVDSFEKVNLAFTVNTGVYGPNGTTTIFCKVVCPDRAIDSQLCDGYDYSGIGAVVYCDKPAVQEPPPPPPPVEEPVAPPVNQTPEPPVEEPPTPPPPPPVPDFSIEITKMFEAAGYDNTLFALNKENNNLQLVFASSDNTKIGQTKSMNFKTDNFDNLDFLLLPNAWNRKSVKNAINSSIQGDGKLVYENNAIYVEYENGEKSVINTDIFHSNGLSTDAFEHAIIDQNDDVITISFEDLKGGGDKDFDDLVIDVRLPA